MDSTTLKKLLISTQGSKTPFVKLDQLINPVQLAKLNTRGNNCEVPIATIKIEGKEQCTLCGEINCGMILDKLDPEIVKEHFHPNSLKLCDYSPYCKTCANSISGIRETDVQLRALKGQLSALIVGVKTVLQLRAKWNDSGFQNHPLFEIKSEQGSVIDSERAEFGSPSERERRPQVSATQAEVTFTEDSCLSDYDDGATFVVKEELSDYTSEEEVKPCSSGKVKNTSNEKFQTPPQILQEELDIRQHLLQTDQTDYENSEKVVFLHTAKYLDYSSLKSCRRVCRQWNTWVIPVLRKMSSYHVGGRLSRGRRSMLAELTNRSEVPFDELAFNNKMEPNLAELEGFLEVHGSFIKCIREFDPSEEGKWSIISSEKEFWDSDMMEMLRKYCPELDSIGISNPEVISNECLKNLRVFGGSLCRMEEEFWSRFQEHVRIIKFLFMCTDEAREYDECSCFGRLQRLIMPSLTNFTMDLRTLNSASLNQIKTLCSNTSFCFQELRINVDLRDKSAIRDLFEVLAYPGSAAKQCKMLAIRVNTWNQTYSEIPIIPFGGLEDVEVLEICGDFRGLGSNLEFLPYVPNLKKLVLTPYTLVPEPELDFRLAFPFYSLKCLFLHLQEFSESDLKNILDSFPNLCHLRIMRYTGADPTKLAVKDLFRVLASSKIKRLEVKMASVKSGRITTFPPELEELAMCDDSGSCQEYFPDFLWMQRMPRLRQLFVVGQESEREEYEENCREVGIPTACVMTKKEFERSYFPEYSLSWAMQLGAELLDLKRMFEGKSRAVVESDGSWTDADSSAEEELG